MNELTGLLGQIGQALDGQGLRIARTDGAIIVMTEPLSSEGWSWFLARQRTLARRARNFDWLREYDRVGNALQARDRAQAQLFFNEEETEMSFTRYSETKVSFGGQLGAVYWDGVSRFAFRPDAPPDAPGLGLKKSDALDTIGKALDARRAASLKAEAQRAATAATEKSAINTKRQLEQQKLMRELRARWAAEDQAGK